MHVHLVRFLALCHSTFGYTHTHTLLLEHWRICLCIGQFGFYLICCKHRRPVNFSSRSPSHWFLLSNHTCALAIPYTLPVAAKSSNLIKRIFRISFTPFISFNFSVQWTFDSFFQCFERHCGASGCRSSSGICEFWCQSVQLIFACVIYELRQSQQNQFQEPDQRVPFYHVIFVHALHSTDVNQRQRHSCVWEMIVWSYFSVLFGFSLLSLSLSLSPSLPPNCDSFHRQPPIFHITTVFRISSN